MKCNAFDIVYGYVMSFIVMGSGSSEKKNLFKLQPDRK